MLHPVADPALISNSSVNWFPGFLKRNPAFIYHRKRYMRVLEEKMGKGYLVELDGLRCIAVFLVMIGHFTSETHLERFTWTFGSMGVTLFFVLSGFLISRILMTEKEKMKNLSKSLKTFYIRRFLRIFPLYYLVLAIAFIADIPSARQYFGWLLSYTANYPAAMTQGGLRYVNHFWTLCVEEQFYIFFPLFIFLLPKKHLLKGFLILTLLAIASRVLIVFIVHDRVPAIWDTYALTPCCFDCFGLGAILAFLYIYRMPRLRILLHRNMIFIAILAVTIFLYNQVRFSPDWSRINIFGRLLFSLICFWAIGKAVLHQFGKWVRGFLTNRLVVYLGKISYGLYVYHFFVPYLMRNVHFAHVRLTYPFITIILAMISWHLYEYPINKLKKHFEYKQNGHTEESLNIHMGRA